MRLLLGQDHFPVEKMHEFDVFNECVTNQPTDRPTYRPAYYRDTRTHLKIVKLTKVLVVRSFGDEYNRFKMRPRISIIGCVPWLVGRLVGWLVGNAFI